MNWRANLLMIAMIAEVTMLGCGHPFHLPKSRIDSSAVWPFIRNDVGGQGSVNSDFSGKLDIIWETSSNDKPAGPLTIQNDYLIYPGAKRKIKFFETENGEFKGRLKVKGVPQSGLTIMGKYGYLALGFPRSRLECIDLTSGDDRWRQPLMDISGAPIIIADHLIVGSTEGRLYSLNLSDGSVNWKVDLSARLTASPIFDGRHIVQTTDDGKLFAFSATDGSEVFAREFEHPLVASAVAGDHLYTAELFGTVRCLAGSDGATLWSRELADPIWSPPALSDGKLYVVHGPDRVSALNAADGRTAWEFSAGEIMVASPTVVGDIVVVGTKKGKVFSLAASDGRMIESRTLKGAISYAPVSDGKRIFLATDKGLIICLGEKNATHSGYSQEFDTQHQPE